MDIHKTNGMYRQGQQQGQQQKIRVVAGLFWRQGRLLVQQRRATQPQALMWEFPGGKVEAGESDRQALIRECREEIGVAIEVGPLAFHTLHTYDPVQVDLYIYHARMAPEALPQPYQAQQIVWLTPSELEGLVFCPADMPCIEDLKAARLGPIDF